MGFRAALIGLAMLAAGSAARTAELVEDFDAGSLDRNVWDDCQLDGEPLKFETQRDADGTLRHVLRNVVDSSTGNRNDLCQKVLALVGRTPLIGQEVPPALDSEAETLGPSLMSPSPLEALGAPECPRGGPDYQRNELRLNAAAGLEHLQTEPHWYSITFRADGDIPSCGSARWILAQWKQERNGASPFLAQRFDNGVLHVTVQNGDCRCVVAQSEGDFDALYSLYGATPGRARSLGPTAPIKCIRSDTDAEVLCRPTGLTVFTLGGSAAPSLPDPKRGWVTMTYLVRGGSDGNGTVDIYANNRFVVRVKGLIGYPTGDPGPVKFKFGHYRDRVGGTASVSVDRVCISPDVAACAPGLKPMP